MIGTIIGDLAAWTYENDQKTFWSRLIPEHGLGASPSAYGLALMKAASHNVLVCPWIDTTPVGSPMDGSNFYGQWLMWQVVGAWMDEDTLKDLPDFDHIEKEEWYAKSFVTNLVKQLRNGATKGEAYHSVWSFEKMSKYWDWRTPGKNLGLLTYVFRAWNVFYLGYDYTSTIRNAVKWPDDRHLTCALAGTFADAMYGCGHFMNKKKYAKTGAHSFGDFGTLKTGEDYDFHHALTHEMAEMSKYRRVFFAKNNALTNVELHHWKDCKVPVLLQYSSDERNRILMAGDTDWKNRYGIYLDDGWLYCYISGWLYLRFKLEKNESSGKYCLTKIQSSGEKPVFICLEGLVCALTQTCRVMVDDEFMDYISRMPANG